MIESIQMTILKWYDNYGRDFPWRHTKDPYKIIIAEFMLHRTRAEQVVSVYLEFIKTYRDVYSLSKARPDDVKKVTEHLGLHWRSRHFIEAAKFVVNRFNGIFPDSYEELRKIPGVGKYIAGAIMAVCFGKPAPIVDSNIARFINRYWNLGLKGEIRRKKSIIKIAEELFNNRDPGKFLFALVDFTSIVCKPQNPDCNNCPLKKSCRSNYGSSPDSGYVVRLHSLRPLRASHTHRTLSKITRSP